MPHRAAIAVGPKAAGKTTFCKKFVAVRNDVILECLADTLTGDGIFWRSLAQTLSKFPQDARVLLDCSTRPEDLPEIVTKFRAVGICTVEAWNFITPEHVCARWFLERYNESTSKLTDARDRRWSSLMMPIAVEAQHKSYKAYASTPVSLAQGFSKIHAVDPQRPPLYRSLLF